MSIPKTIHYCWFGGKPLPKSARRCIESWKRHCPGYEIVEWNESNFDVSRNRYASEAAECGKYAFVSDYARLAILAEHGGFYFDVDVEILRNIDELTELEGFMGFENEKEVATGLGFGACRENPVVLSMLRSYDDLPFVLENGECDTTPCPRRNTADLVALGLIPDGKTQTLDHMKIFSSEYFAPKDYYTGKVNVTENTYSIHHYNASWLPFRDKFELALLRFMGPKLFYRLYERPFKKY